MGLDLPSEVSSSSSVQTKGLVLDTVGLFLSPQIPPQNLVLEALQLCLV